MKTLSCRLLAWSVVLLTLHAGFAIRSFAADPEPFTGSVELEGSVTGTGTGDRDHAKDYDGKYKFSAVYSVAVKTDASGKKEFDYTKSKVLFDDPKDGFTTKSVPITHINGDPATGKIKSFDFSGPDWYPDDGSGAVGTGFKGTVKINEKNPKKGTAELKATYKDKNGNTVSNYSFTSGSPKPPKPPKKGTNGKPFETETRIPSNESIDYDAATGILSIHGDVVVATPSAGDPILGASLTFPEFLFTGFTVPGGLAVFWPTDETPYLMALGDDLFARSTIPFLYFDVSSASFYAPLSNLSLAGMASDSPFYHPDLTGISSPFLSTVASLLDPSSPEFVPRSSLYLTIAPDVNFLALTDHFTVSGTTGANDREFVSVPVPGFEPPTALLFGAALAFAWAVRRRVVGSRRIALAPRMWRSET